MSQLTQRGHCALIVEAGDWCKGVQDTLYSSGTWGFPLDGDNKLDSALILQE